MNLERAWAWRPDLAEGFALLRRRLIERTSLMPTEIALLACTTARALGDSYCSLAWGTKLAGMRGTAAVADVLHGLDPPASTPREADHQLVTAAPEGIRAAVTYGRPHAIDHGA